MNKDNKKMAMQRKAQEREKARKAAQWKRFLPLLILAAAAAVIAIVWALLRKPATDQTQTLETVSSDQSAAVAEEKAEE